MATLAGQTIASSYEQLLSLPDGGGNANTLVAVTDGDAGTTFGIKLATNKVEIIPGSNDANAFEVSQADGTAVFTVNTSTAGASVAGTLSTTGRFTMSNDGSDNGLFLGGGWQIFDNASESFGTAGDLVFYHGAGRMVLADTGELTLRGDGSDQTTSWHSGSAYVNAKLDVRQLAIAFSGTDKITSDTNGNTTFGADLKVSRANDGGDVHFQIINSAGGVSSSTQETTSLKFLHGKAGTSGSGASNVDMGKIVVGRESTNENDSATDGFMAFHTTENDSVSEKMRINSSGQALFSDGSASDPSVSFKNDDDTGLYSGGTGAITFVSQGNRVLELQSSLLAQFSGDIDINGSGTRQIKFNDSAVSEGAIVFDEITNGFIFKVGGTSSAGKTDALHIKNDGKIGVGVSSPSHLLEIYQDASSYPVLIKQNQGDGLCLDVFASSSDQASNDAIIRARTNHATLLQLMNDGRMIVQQSHIQVAGAVIPGTANEADNNKIFTSSSGSGSTPMFVGNAQIQVSSDKRLKTNIRDTEMNPIETLNKLRIVDFDWDDPSDTSWNNKMARVENGGQWSGILAQEAVEVVPHIINAPRIEETLELDHKSKNTWQVEYEHLVPTLVKAIQELSAKVEELENKLGE
tara:strand:+ start:2319 stop:4220 length:1902 start_codon:yes stop_codon:yes gene_type:complete